MYLHLDTTVELDKLKTAEGCITNARSPEVVAALEELVTQWCQQIEQVCVCVCVVWDVEGYFAYFVNKQKGD